MCRDEIARNTAWGFKTIEDLEKAIKVSNKKVGSILHKHMQWDKRLADAETENTMLKDALKAYERKKKITEKSRLKDPSKKELEVLLKDSREHI